MSERKAIVSLRHPVTIGDHISSEISETRHRLSILKIAKFSPSMLERAFLTFTTVNFEKVEKGRIFGIHEGGNFFLIFFVYKCSPYPGRSGNDMWLKWLGG